MKLACFYILKKRLNYCDFISYRRYLVPVSYTHLTLPTILRV